MHVWSRLALMLGLASLSATALGAEVQGARVWSGPESTRVVLDLSEPAQHHMFSLSGPDRVVIDLPRTSLASPIRFSEAKGFVTNIRTGIRPSGELRVVLDLEHSVESQSFLLPPDQQSGHRLVVDLMPAGTETVVRRAPVATTENGRELVIAIDPGHGGKDPGASGPNGVREKDVVLAISRQLAEEVDSVPGMRSLLVRNADNFVSHRRRMEIAHADEADLFISIHADAFHDSRAHGATVYALSTKRASDEAARVLAERENASDLIGGVSLSDKDDVLARVLLDLSQSAAISASMSAGERLIDELGTVTRVRKAHVQQGPFVVLTSPDIPSILIETAYISNPAEEAALNDRRHQVELARALRAGIVRYFRTNAPPDSYFALTPPPVPRAPTRHIIIRGETLSEIAERYRVSLRSLRLSNSIRGDIIRIGQVLMIPSG